MPTVFISYSHKDESWKDKLVPHLRALEQAGVQFNVWHDRKIDGGDKWYPEIQQAMDSAVVGILLISADFLASDFCVKEEVPFLIERQEKHGMLLIPLLVRKCPWKAHRWLADRQMIPRDGKCVAIDYAGDNADAVFTEVAEAVYSHFVQLAANNPSAVPNTVKAAAQAEAAKIPIKAGTHLPVTPRWPTLAPERVSLSHLPETGATLFGREEELTLLDQLWESGASGADAGTRVLAFRAQGGVGKSTLINHWLAEMKRDHFRGASRVFGWSFYSQGVRERGAASADTFMAAALRFFGDEAMAGSPASAWDKGARLAHLAGSQRALLILDGMEPLQSANWVDRGKLLDPGLESLLRGLARQSSGLCIITTREPLAELGRKPGIAERDLEQISPQAGRSLLRSMHVSGSDGELEELAGRFGPHALAIALLAVYLREHAGQGIALVLELEQMPGNTPVDRVLAGFEKLLANSAELEALRLLGFFDRPADEGCLGALRAAPAISGLTGLLVGMSNAEWHRVLARLDKLRLIHVRKNEAGRHLVDTHPLIREHFARELRTQQPDAWRAAHRRLYEYLCATAPECTKVDERDKLMRMLGMGGSKDEPQPTLEDLQPLYQAVAHGCQAGLQQEAHDDVHLRRIRRGGREDYSTNKLGAFSSDLGALACFYEQPWSKPSPNLRERDQAILLSNAAFRLRALGRLTEALEPMRAGVKMGVQAEDWDEAARRASNLSELELTLGEVAAAERNAAQSVTYADRSGDAFQRQTERVIFADALHQAGRRSEAETRFREAEQMQQERQPDYPLLYSGAGFRYCDLLLAAPERAAWQIFLRSSRRKEAHSEKPDDAGEKPEGSQSLLTSAATEIESCRAVSQRAAQTLKWVTTQNWLLDIALDHLTLGRAALYAAILSGSSLATCHSSLENAVSGLRHSGNMDDLPRGLLTRAWQRFLAGKPTGPESAQSDLDAAWEIAERGPMKLHMADIHLYRARLFGRKAGVISGQSSVISGEKYPWESPAADLAAAEKLINACGYHRGDEELADAKQALLGS